MLNIKTGPLEKNSMALFYMLGIGTVNSYAKLLFLYIRHFLIHSVSLPWKVGKYNFGNYEDSQIKFFFKDFNGSSKNLYYFFIDF